MLTLLKLGSLLLSYPDDELLAELPALRTAALAGAALPARERAAWQRLFDTLLQDDAIAAQERYCGLFDRTRALSLHLFEHVHGESRDRGQAMVDLLALYGRTGLVPDSNELPDHLPVFLEYLSTLAPAEAAGRLGDVAHVLEVLHERLQARASPYAAVFASLLRQADRVATDDDKACLLAEEDDPEDLDSLDRVWQEQSVRFDGAGALADCPAMAPTGRGPAQTIRIHRAPDASSRGRDPAATCAPGPSQE